MHGQPHIRMTYIIVIFYDVTSFVPHAGNWCPEVWRWSSYNNTLSKKKAQSQLILGKYLRVSFRDNALYCTWLQPRHTKSHPQWLPTAENHKTINSEQKFTPGSRQSFCTQTAASESQAWEWFMGTITSKNMYTVSSKHVGSNVNHHHTCYTPIFSSFPCPLT